MADETMRQSPPKEASNRGHNTEHQRGNITEAMSVRYNGDAEHEDDGSSAGKDAEADPVEEEMEIARAHADPSKGDKVVDGGDRVSTEEGGNPQE
jgi:hypothetical protein